jgi:HTH-type transcriptional regulator/antitoxin HigA
MNIFPIKTESDYDAALARIDELMNAEFETPEGDERPIA